jgi:integrase
VPFERWHHQAGARRLRDDETYAARIARDALCSKVFPHRLRHSWMTEMLRSGMNPIQLSSIAGASVEVISQSLHAPDQGRRVRRHAEGTHGAEIVEKVVRW